MSQQIFLYFKILYFQESSGADDTFCETGSVCGTAQFGRTVSTIIGIVKWCIVVLCLSTEL